MADGDRVRAEAARRRTFAIISHPDAGKTTLTEKFLLYGGALGHEAGAVKGKGGRRGAASDWMALEQQRGISITSSALQFEYRDAVVNLIDTPGHRDFSEDTYRVLAAADAAVMVLDSAKGIEPQTRKLFEVCRARDLPILTFLNKWDRPALDPIELLDEIESTLDLALAPATWPIGAAEDFVGIVDRERSAFVRYQRTAHGATVAPEERLGVADAARDHPEAWAEAEAALDLLDGVGATFDREAFLAGTCTPVFFGSALTNFGVRPLLDAVVDLVPPPAPRLDADGRPRPVDAPFSGFVFKVQANMDPAHRDRVAFLRVCSGRFERGMVVTHQQTGRPIATKYAQQLFGQGRETVEEAFPGDIVGLVNANEVRVGDALWSEEPVTWPAVPSFAPEHFQVARPRDISRFKQFRKGIAQLDEEGVVQVLRDRDLGDQAPVLAAVGPMQFDVALFRLEREFGAPAILEGTRFQVARRTDATSAPALRAMSGVDVLERADGSLFALFESRYWVERLEREQPELHLERLVAEGMGG